MKTRIDEAYEKGVYDGQRGDGLDDFSESDTADVFTTIVAPHIAILDNLFESEEEEAYKKGYEYGMKHRYDENGNRYHEPYPKDEEIKEEKERSSSRDDSADTDSIHSGGYSSSMGGDATPSCAGPVLLIIGLFVSTCVGLVLLKIGLFVLMPVLILGKGTKIVIDHSIDYSSELFSQSVECFSEKRFSITTKDVNTGEEKIIISSAAYSTFYKLSPNGKKILFTQVFNHRPHLFVADIDGKNKVCLSKVLILIVFFLTAELLCLIILIKPLLDV